MNNTGDFVSNAVELIERWHGVSSPHAIALEMVSDLKMLVSSFEALRGSLRFEDEPSSFEAALTEAANVKVSP